MVDKFDIKAAVGAVLINAVQENLASTKLFTGFGKLQCIDVSAFPTAFDGALIPADLGAQKLNSYVSNKLLVFS